MEKGEHFIRSHTALSAPSAVPELQLWMAAEVTPLWQATESWLAENNCAPPYWAFAWAGGQALARYLFDHPEAVRGKRVFDMASGSGIAALAAVQCGAVAVTANEIDALALQAIAMNAAANNLALDTYAGDASGATLAEMDVILAGDVCYEKAMTDRLILGVPICRNRASNN